MAVAQVKLMLAHTGPAAIYRTVSYDNHEGPPMVILCGGNAYVAADEETVGSGDRFAKALLYRFADKPVRVG